MLQVSVRELAPSTWLNRRQSYALRIIRAVKSDFPQNSLSKKQKARYNSDERFRSAELPAKKARRDDRAKPNDG